MNGNDNEWSGIKMALYEIKWKAMTMHEVNSQAITRSKEEWWRMKENNNYWVGNTYYNMIWNAMTMHKLKVRWHYMTENEKQWHSHEVELRLH